MARIAEYELSNNENPKCPYCGEFYDINDNEAWDLYSPGESKHEIECNDCGEKYFVQSIVKYTFSTDKDDIF